MSPPCLPPSHTQILVIGGGPAGSYAAAALAREGLDVTLFEASKFPRYHVGESLIPSVRHYLRFIGADAKLESHGFVRKPGSAIKFNQFKREGYTDFVAIGCNNFSWNVVRSEFDHILMNHARSCGASVYEKTKVDSISFSLDDPDKPVSVNWTHTPPPVPISPPASPGSSSFFRFLPGAKATVKANKQPQNTELKGTTSFTHIVDATGRAGIMSTRYLKNRRFHASLKNIAVWGYWRGTGSYGTGSSRSGAPWFEALTDESGWAWFIPLHNGTTSVGVVMNEKMYNFNAIGPLRPSPFAPSAASNPSSSIMVKRYLSNLSLAPGVVKLISLNGKMDEGSVSSASDFSYSAPSHAGPGYRIIGDAGAFIDPFFSSGVHLAFTSALSAAATICASIRGHCSELEAAQWHTKRISTSYTRFLVVVLSAYKQIRAQSDDVLCDIDEDNYDRAFAFLRPVIQGASDMGARLSETELQKSLDFCVNLFNPTSPEQHEGINRNSTICKALLDVAAPIIDPIHFENTMQVEMTSYVAHGSDSEISESERISETKMILNKVNARRVVHSEFSANNLESEPLDGFVVKLEKGKLGLAGIRE